jgi:lipoprotein-anchoring transpeptidase ErfK/SrfK
MKLSSRVGLLVATVAVTPVLLAGCTGHHAAAPAAAPSPPTLTVSPADRATGVPVSAEIAAATDGRLSAVRLTDDRGAAVDGAMRPDGSSWLPNRPLEFARSYTAEATATGPSGKTSTQKVRFTTMARPAKQVDSTMYVDSGRTYGVNMPLTVAFEPGVPKEARAAVQRRLLVSTEPAQPGTWAWLADGTQAYYRAPDPWRPGTKISVRAALAGVPMGAAGYGDADHTATATIGDKVTLDIDNATKQMSVYKDDRLVRRIPVSLGKPSTPSSSGRMVIMEKYESTVFDTRGEPNGGYVVQVNNAQRLTWGGEFIHAAPWSEGDQGYTNVSHGCANVSDEAAAWLMRTTHVGDLVTVRGTEVQLEPGNGWTAWNMSWEEFARGSALPVPPDLKPSAASPSPPPAAPTGTGAPTAAPSASVGG